ncbi:MAG: cobalamin-dependent protein, partial [Clostridiales bacterium]|nr:cobalamin-dependent protein [Clostridiales bacterium]
MKILLVAVNAKYIHSSLALRSIAAYNAEYADLIELREYTINNDMSRVTADIFKRDPDVVGISCYIWNYSYVRKITGELKKVRPDLPIWLGGPEVSFDAEDFLTDNRHITGIVRGEGEATWKDLISAYAKGRPELKDIPGITFRQGETILRCRDREPIDLNEIPLCYESVGDFDNRIIYYEGSRGCPFRCSYCLSSADCRLRFKTIEKIKKEIIRATQLVGDIQCTDDFRVEVIYIDPVFIEKAT